MDRLGLANSTSAFPEASFAEFQQLARDAEAAGFEAIFSAEYMNDTLGAAQVMAQATSRIKVGTWVANSTYATRRYVRRRQR
jgi:alkanesulfonate monooxygenase SsuD/methylene tetrahydromethanopterin reductase-like flavin-dependent oxidoreductase (luciferase family)